TEAYRSGQGNTTLSEFARPIEAVPEQASVAAALELMLRNREHILLVVDEYGGLEGIVTLEDAIETLLGMEIVDEADATADLQALARRLAQR
ncbi:MAG: CBS domain-containing protein, partial [Phycisphaerales bacterium]